MVTAHRIVFIVGLHRSGTTPLTRILGNHPDTSGFTDAHAPMGEGQYLQTVMRSPTGDVLDNTGSVALKPRNRLNETSTLATPENAEKLWREWSAHWDLSRPVLLEKSPGHILKTRLLQYFFPESRFLVITRHPLAQAIAISKWADNRSPLQFVINWGLAHKALLRDLAHIRQKHILRYEDLCSDPEGVLQGALDFAGLASAPSILDREMINSNDRYFEQWREQGRSLRARAYASAMPPLVGKTAAMFGYGFPDRTDPACPVCGSPPS